MSQKNLPITACLVVSFLVTGNILMKPWSARLPYHKKLEEIRLTREPNLLFIGNSLLDGHVDKSALQEGIGLSGSSVRPVNAALGGSEPHVHALLMDYAVRCHPQLSTVVIGAFDFQLTKEERMLPADLTGSDSVAVDGRFSVPEVTSVYHFSPIEEVELRFLRAVPMVAYRKNAWRYVEMLRRRMGEMGLPHAQININGRAVDFAGLEAGTAARFDGEANEYLKNPGVFNSSYERILNEAAGHRLHVVVVIMPMSPVHRDEYYSRPSWKAYLALESERLEERGVTVIDASGWLLRSSQFADSLHMTQASATEFSFRLGKELHRLN